MSRWEQARRITLEQAEGWWFAVLIDGREPDPANRFRSSFFERCGRCGADPPTYVPKGDPGLMAMCEACIVEVISVMVFAAESAIERRGSRNGQG